MSFQKEFDELRAMGEGTFVLRGATIIVEVLEQEEVKTQSGLIISAPKSQARGGIAEHRLEVAKVLMTGPGYFIDEPADGGAPAFEALEVKPGAIVVLPQYGAQFISVFPGISRPTNNKLAMIKMDQVLAYYPSNEAYEAAKAKLNA